MACAPSEGSDQLGHAPSLIRVFAVRMNKAWVFCYPLRRQERLWSDWVDPRQICLRWAHSHYVGLVMRRLISCPRTSFLDKVMQFSPRNWEHIINNGLNLDFFKENKHPFKNIQLFHNEWEHHQFSPLYNDISVLWKLNKTVVTIWWVPNIKYTCTGNLKLFIGHR